MISATVGRPLLWAGAGDAQDRDSPSRVRSSLGRCLRVGVRLLIRPDRRRRGLLVRSPRRDLRHGSSATLGARLLTTGHAECTRPTARRPDSRRGDRRGARRQHDHGSRSSATGPYRSAAAISASVRDVQRRRLATGIARTGRGDRRERPPRAPRHGCAPAPHVLREYALLADGERGAVLGPARRHRLDVRAALGQRRGVRALIGGASVYSVTPVGRIVWGGYYEDASMIWRSRWITATGIIECREALAYPAEPAPRGPAPPDPCRGRPRQPSRSCCGRGPTTTARRSKELHRARGVWTARVGDLYLRWSGGRRRPAVHRRRLALALRLRLDAGQRHDLVLEISDRPLPDPTPDPAEAWRATETWWRQAVPTLHTRARARRLRVAATPSLRGLTSSERWDGRRRHHQPARTGRSRTQLRLPLRVDPRPVLRRQAAAAAGADPLLDDAVAFVAARLLEHGDRLAPAYTTTGEPVPDQRHLDLPGYPGGYDIIGNWVNQQFQLDAFGEALLLFAAAARRDRLDGDTCKAADIAAAAIARRWTRTRRRDLGDRQPALDAQPPHRRRGPARRRRRLPARPPARTGSPWPTTSSPTPPHTRYTLTGHWQRSPEDPALDAALLLPGLRGAVPPTTRAPAATLHAYLRRPDRRRLRLPIPPRRPPTRDAEGSFLLCGFLDRTLPARQGDASSARAGSNAPAPPAVRRSCSARNTTPSNTRCAATSPKPSCTP